MDKHLRALLDLIEEARGDLRKWIQSHWEVLELKRRTDQRVRIWYTAQSVLAWDLSGSIVTLLTAGDVRAAVILNRSLLEYWVNIVYFEKRRSAIVRAFKQIVPRFRKMAAAEPRQLVATYTVEEKRKHRRLLGSAPVKIDYDQIRRMFEVAFGKRRGLAIYDRGYGLWSALVHGNEATIPDVFRNFWHEHEPRNEIDWTTRTWKRNDAAGVTAQLLIEIIRAVEHITGRGNVARVLDKEFSRITKEMERDEALAINTRN